MVMKSELEIGYRRSAAVNFFAWPGPALRSADSVSRHGQLSRVSPNKSNTRSLLWAIVYQQSLAFDLPKDVGKVQ